jgi:Tfp pilus assembly protein PilO
MRLGPREQIIATVAIVVIVIVAIGAFAVFPQFQQLGALDAKITQARTDVESAKGLLAVRVQSKNRAAETDAKWLRLANLVPDGPDLPSLIVELQDAAFASGVQLTAVTPSPPTSGATYYTIPMSLQVIGTWADTVDYLQRIMKLNRGVRIIESSSIRTTNSDQASKENLTLPDYSLATTIKIETYMIPSSSPTATPTPAPGH